MDEGYRLISSPDATKKGRGLFTLKGDDISEEKVKKLFTIFAVVEGLINPPQER